MGIWVPIIQIGVLRMLVLTLVIEITTDTLILMYCSRSRQNIGLSLIQTFPLVRACVVHL